MHRHYPAVPTTREVVPGAGVNIVLKQDQPTGRTVSGVVRDVLTRGDHPRGIKVRLADGRVGRVQSLAAGEVKAATEVAGEETSPGGAGLPAWGGGDGRPFGPRRGRGRGMEEGEGEGLPSQQIGLDAYIKPAKQRGKRRGNAGGGGPGEQSGSGERMGYELPKEVAARCPVCDEFEGDEAAVAHHVAGHFGDA